MILAILAAGLAVQTAAYASDPANLPVPPKGFDSKSSSIPHGKVDVSLSYQTTKYGQQKVTVYTPPGYSTSEKYPVLYLFHGIGGNEVSWIGQGSNEGNADNVMDYLYSQKLATPMIVVMPDGNTKGASDGFGAFGDVLLTDLIPWIEKTYSAATDPDSRAISGLSMGGGQTFNFGFPHTDIFHYIGPYSAAPNTQPPTQTIKDVATVKKNVKVIYISYGSTDGLINNGQAYHTYFDQNNVTHIWQIEQGLGHEKTVWDRSLYNFAQRIFLGGGGPGIDGGTAPGSGGASGTGGGAAGAPGAGGAAGRDASQPGGRDAGSAAGGSSAEGGSGAATATGGSSVPSGRGGNGSGGDQGRGGGPGSGGSSAAAGTGGSTGSGTTAGGSGGATTPSPAANASGCSCQIDLPGRGGGTLLLLGLFAVLLGRRRLARRR